jgi:hypothetical protein
MVGSKLHLPRRTVLRGLGATVGLPLLDAMVPAFASPVLQPPRFAAIEIVHGAAGSTAYGRDRNLWSPAEEGRNFAFSDTLQPFETLRDYVTIVSNTRLRNAESFTTAEDGDMVDHARSSSVFLTGAHPKATAGADVECAASIDQIYARRGGRGTPIPSLQLCLEENGLTGACSASYSCAYTHTISWASPHRPLPMEASPRVVFDRLFAVRAAGGASILDTARDDSASLRRELGRADRVRLDEHLEAVRRVERRIQAIEADLAFEEHAALMFELMRLAFATDATRVATLKLGVDRSQRVFPGSGTETPFHTLSHHKQLPARIEEFARLNKYHAGIVAQFLASLRATPDGDGNLLDHSIVLYGSPMGDSHVHDHRFLPLLLAGRGNGALQGNLHLACREDTPMANLLLTVLHKLGVELGRIGDSTGTLAI